MPVVRHALFVASGAGAGCLLSLTSNMFWHHISIVPMHSYACSCVQLGRKHETCVGSSVALLQVSLLNFLVTPEGLEEQLLGTTVATERPDLANMKTQLVLSNARMKKELKDVEDKILFMLSNSQVPLQSTPCHT